MSAGELMMTDDSGTALQAAVKAGHALCQEIANAMFWRVIPTTSYQGRIAFGTEFESKSRISLRKGRET